MPGDPKRASHIAEAFLDNAELVTEVRGMTGYTGTYEGTRVSVMPSGMGMPSAAIYITELVRFYGVKSLIRVGTAGVYSADVPLRQVVVGTEAVTNSCIPGELGYTAPLLPSARLLSIAETVAADTGVDLLGGKIFSSDIFYEKDDSVRETQAAMGVVAVEMEAAALYALCDMEGAEALTLLTMTDHLVTGEHLSSEERQTTVDEMLELGLRVAVGAS